LIYIDGSFGSGGGQVLRTAVGLSALLHKPVSIQNIRIKRPNPGLQEQHLQAIKAVAQVCQGELKGAYLGSTSIEFYPSKIIPGNYNIKIATAGSVSLLLQALLLPSSQGSFSFHIKGGGTYGKWSPPISYLLSVFLPLISQMGYKVKVKVLREGFYPRGGAEVVVNTEKANFFPLYLLKPGKVREIRGVSVASRNLQKRKVAERQRDSAWKILKQRGFKKVNIEIEYVSSSSCGSGINLVAITEHSLLGGNALGERGKKAEEVGEEAARNLLLELKGAVDRYAGDQLLPYLAFGGGQIRVSEVTDHLLTNAWVIEKFLPVKIHIEKDIVKIIG